MLNCIIFIGTLGKQPELKKTNSGLSVLSVDVACQRDQKDADGNRQTDWISVTAWRQSADYLAQYADKGDRVVVEGRLQSRKWKDKEGNTRVAWEVVADHIALLDAKRKGKPVLVEVDEDPGEVPF